MKILPKWYTFQVETGPFFNYYIQVKNSFFAVSSHIVEAAYKLNDISNIQFAYLEIIKRDNIPEYTYKLKEGISENRLGMYILQQEKLIETIKEINN